jgi:hypothetical protein
MSTTTSPADGVGSGRSTSRKTSGPPCSRISMTSMMALLARSGAMLRDLPAGAQGDAIPPAGTR